MANGTKKMIENEDLEKQLHALEVAIVEAKNNSTVENLKEIVQINLFWMFLFKIFPCFSSFKKLILTKF